MARAHPKSPYPTRASFRQYIEELTRLAEENPQGYRMRVILLVIKGYGYIVGLILVLLLAIAAIVVLAVTSRNALLGIPLVILAFFAFIFLMALRPRIPAPKGARLETSEAPELHRMLERVRTQLGVPAPYAVLPTSDFNASIVQHPRFGLFGGYRSYVIIGLPLLEALPPEEFEAVIAHEFGHLAGQHGRFAAWVFAIGETWNQILFQLEATSHGTGLVRGFLRGFVPEFDATTFVLARAQEYEADRAAAKVTDARTVGFALVRISLIRRARERFHASLSERVEVEPDPPPDVFGEEIRMYRAGVESKTAGDWLKDALARPTDLDDTHPSLADRLSALGVDPAALPAASPRSAAEAYLASVREQWRREISQGWFDENEEAWREQHAALSQAREEHEHWKSRVANGNLAKEDQLSYAKSIHNHEGAEAAILHLREWVNAEPGDHRCRLMLGNLLLSCGDESGLEHLSVVVAVEPAIVTPHCQTAYEWLFHRGRMSEADQWFEQQKRCAHAYEQGRIERQTLAASNEFLPHGLAAEVVEPIRRAVQALNGIQAAWLVRKRLLVVPDEPLWLLIVAPKWSIHAGPENRADKILKDLKRTIPPLKRSVHVVLMPDLAPLRPKLEAIESARLRGPWRERGRSG